VSALARAEGVRQQSMGATISALEEAGLVKGSPDPADGRRTTCLLQMPAGEMLRPIGQRRGLVVPCHPNQISPGEQEELATALELLKAPRRS